MHGEEEMRAARASLLESGFAILRGVLDRSAISAMQAACARRLAAAPRDHLEANRTTGSMLGVDGDPAFADLIAEPTTLALLRSFGFGQLAWSAGYVIVKPAGGPRLFWHQDWLFWDHPVSAEPMPHQVFAMYYAVDTNRENGCLRVVPGSHRRRLPAHDRLTLAHSRDALSGSDEQHPMFGDVEDEIDVPVRAGDLLVGDSRLLHAAHRNASASPRALVTLWYHPAYDRLPTDIQAYFAEHYGSALSEWPAAARNRIDCALPYAPSAVQPRAIRRDPHSARF